MQNNKLGLCKGKKIVSYHRAICSRWHTIAHTISSYVTARSSSGEKKKRRQWIGSFFFIFEKSFSSPKTDYVLEPCVDFLVQRKKSHGAMYCKLKRNFFRSSFDFFYSMIIIFFLFQRLLFCCGPRKKLKQFNRNRAAFKFIKMCSRFPFHLH